MHGLFYAPCLHSSSDLVMEKAAFIKTKDWGEIPWNAFLFFVLNKHGTSVCRKEWTFHMEHQSLCFKDMTMSGDTNFKLV